MSEFRSDNEFTFMDAPPPETIKQNVVLEPAVVKTEEKSVVEEKPTVAETKPQETSKPEEKPVIEEKKPAVAETKPTETIVNDKPIPEVKPDYAAFLGDATKGAIKTPEELTAALARMQQLEADIQKPKYKSPQEEKIAGFLNEYGGSDYGLAFQTYLKLQNTDVMSLDPAAAIKEDMVLANMKLGMSAAKAELLADREIDRKYADDEDGLFKERDGIQAKQRLEALKQESKGPAVNPQQEAQRKQQEQLQQDQVQARTNYLTKVGEVFSKTPEPTKMKLSDDPKEDITFKPYDFNSLKPKVENFNNYIFERYSVKDAQGKPTGVLDPALMAKDIERMETFDAKVKEAFEHGISIGTERYIKSRANIKTPTETNGAGNGVAKERGGEWSFPNGI
jgi:hypothetical protein